MNSTPKELYNHYYDTRSKANYRYLTSLVKLSWMNSILNIEKGKLEEYKYFLLDKDKYL